MKFNIQSKLLLSHLSAVGKVISSKNTISILDNFLFSLEGDKLTITGSDQETTLTTVVQVNDAEGSGKFAADVKQLLEMLKQMPDLGLEFDINDVNLEINIRYLNGKFNFIGINGNEFPQKLETGEEPQHFTLPIKKMVRGLQQAIFAVGVEKLRPVMMGVYWDIKPDEIIFVASDTHKLVKFEELGLDTGLTTSFILPTKPASILSSVFERIEGDANITVDSKSITVEADGYTMTSRFMNGRYPNYNSVIPAENPYEVVVDRMTLLNELRRVAVFSSSGGLVKLSLSKDEIFMTTQDIDFSTAAEAKVACEYDGDEMVIGFNAQHIIDVLANINNETIHIKLMDPSRAGIFLPNEQAEGEKLLVLLMPMMIQG